MLTYVSLFNYIPTQSTYTYSHSDNIIILLEVKKYTERKHTAFNDSVKDYVLTEVSMSKENLLNSWEIH